MSYLKCKQELEKVKYKVGYLSELHGDYCWDSSWMSGERDGTMKVSPFVAGDFFSNQGFQQVCFVSHQHTGNLLSKHLLIYDVENE